MRKRRISRKIALCLCHCHNSSSSAEDPCRWHTPASYRRPYSLQKAGCQVALATVLTATSKFPIAQCGAAERCPFRWAPWGEGTQCWSPGPFYLLFLRDGDWNDMGHTANQGPLRTLNGPGTTPVCPPRKAEKRDFFLCGKGHSDTSMVSSSDPDEDRDTDVQSA